MAGNYLEYPTIKKQLMNETMDMLKFIQYVVCGNFTLLPQVWMTMYQLEIIFLNKKKQKIPVLVCFILL